MKIIAVEEHFFTEEYLRYLRSRTDYPRLETIEDEKHCKVERMSYSNVLMAITGTDIMNRLLDLREGRLREMDKAGITLQVLSLSTGVELLDASHGIAMAKRTNNELSQAVEKFPDRFAGFAALAPQDPDAAADELERSVKELGLKGAMINSHIYLDDQKYWAIFGRAEQLGVPIYLHPRPPSEGMLKPYLAYPGLAGSMWGFAAELGLHAMRLICSGVFDKYPNLKVILGHLGEALPFWLWRIDNRWLKEKVNSRLQGRKLKKKPSQYFKDNFWVTTSGMFWQPTLMFTHLALGADKILFAVDYPYDSNREAVEFMKAAPICSSDKEKVYHLNAEKLLAL